MIIISININTNRNRGFSNELYSQRPIYELPEGWLQMLNGGYYLPMKG